MENNFERNKNLRLINKTILITSIIFILSSIILNISIIPFQLLGTYHGGICVIIGLILFIIIGVTAGLMFFKTSIINSQNKIKNKLKVGLVLTIVPTLLLSGITINYTYQAIFNDYMIYVSTGTGDETLETHEGIKTPIIIGWIYLIDYLILILYIFRKIKFFKYQRHRNKINDFKSVT